MQYIANEKRIHSYRPGTSGRLGKRRWSQ